MLDIDTSGRDHLWLCDGDLLVSSLAILVADDGDLSSIHEISGAGRSSSSPGKSRVNGTTAWRRNDARGESETRDESTSGHYAEISRDV